MLPSGGGGDVTSLPDPQGSNPLVAERNGLKPSGSDPASGVPPRLTTG